MSSHTRLTWRTLVAAAGLILFSGACSFEALGFGQPPQGRATLQVSAALPPGVRQADTEAPAASARTLNPTSWSLEVQIETFRFRFVPLNGNPHPEFSRLKSRAETILSWPSFSLNLPDVPFGDWRIEVQALNLNGQPLLEGLVGLSSNPGMTTITVSGTTESLSCQMALRQSETGTGRFTLNLRFPANMPGLTTLPAELALQLLSRPGGVIGQPYEFLTILTAAYLPDQDGDPSTDDAFYSADLPVLASGDYTLRLAPAGWTGTGPYLYEVLHIYDNLVTDTQWMFDAMQFGGLPSAPMAPTGAQPPPVGQLLPGNAGEGTVNRAVLNWETWESVIGFKIYRRSDPLEAFALVHQTSPFDRSWTDMNGGAGLSAGVPYEYEIRSLRFAGESMTALTTGTLQLATTGELEATLADRPWNLIASPSPNLDTVYGKTPVWADFGQLGGRTVPIRLYNRGTVTLNLADLAVTGANFSGRILDAVTKTQLATLNLGETYDGTLQPGQALLAEIRHRPLNLGAAETGQFSLMADGSPLTFTLTGTPRERVLYVSGYGSGNGESPAAPMPLSQALEQSVDGDTLRLQSTDIHYGHFKLSRRVLVEGGYGPDFVGPDAQSYPTVLQGWDPGKATLLIEDTPLAPEGTFEARVTGLRIQGYSGAPATVLVRSSRVYLDNLTITLPPHDFASVGLRIEDSGYQSFVTNTVFTTQTMPQPAQMIWLDVASASVDVTNCQFENPMSLRPTAGPAIAARFGRGSGGPSGFTFAHNRVLVPSSGALGEPGYGVLVEDGEPGIVQVLRGNRFRFQGQAPAGSTDTALHLTSFGDGPYKPLVEANRVYFTAPTPARGVETAHVDVNALIFGNLFTQITPLGTAPVTGLEDRGTETRIYANSFFTLDTQTGEAPQVTWVRIASSQSRPRISNNLFSGRWNGTQASSTGIAVNAGLSVKPTDLNHNVFADLTLALSNPDYGQNAADTASINNTSLALGGKILNNRVLAPGAWYPALQSPEAWDGATPYPALLRFDDPIALLFGGENLSAAVDTWVSTGPVQGPGPSFADPFGDQRRNTNTAHAGRSVWAVGADELMSSMLTSASAPYTSWPLDNTIDKDDQQMRYLGANWESVITDQEGFSLANAVRSARPGASGSSVFFNGRLGALTAGTVAETFDQGWTVALWFGGLVPKIAQYSPQRQYLIGTSGTDNWGLYYDPAQQQLRVHVKGEYANIGAPLPVEALYRRWNHLVLVVDRVNGFLRLYLNGNLILDQAGIPGLMPYDGATQTLGIGMPGNQAQNRFYGILDDVKLYRRVVGPDEVAVWITQPDASPALTVPAVGAFTNYGGASFSPAAVPPGLGTNGQISAPGVSGANRYALTWTTSDGLRGLVWAATPQISLSALAPQSYTYKIFGVEAGTGSSGGGSGSGGFVSSYPGSSPAESLKGLWTFGWNEGRNLATPTDQASANFSGNNANEFYDPAFVPDGLDPWAGDYLSPGAVWMGPGTYLNGPMSAGLNIHDPLRPDWTVAVRFRLNAPLNNGEARHIMKWQTNDGTLRHFVLGLSRNSDTDFVTLQSQGNFVDIPLTGFALQMNRTYRLQINYSKTGTDNVQVFLDNGSALPLVSTLAYQTSGMDPQQLQLGSPSEGLRGWIEEVRVYDVSLAAQGQGAYDAWRNEANGN